MKRWMSNAQQARLLVAAALVLSVLAVALVSASNRAGASPHPALPTPARGIQPPETTGKQPIHPYPDGVLAIPVRSMQPPGPNFTAADVARYFQAHRLQYQTPNSPPLHVTRVEFLTSAQASAELYGMDTGRPTDALLCLARVHGSFTVSGVRNGQPATATFTDGWALFDAVTGVLLVEQG